MADDAHTTKQAHRAEDAYSLALTEGWSEAVYTDLLAIQAGTLSEAEFNDKYLVRHSILVLDFTGFTETALHGGALRSFLRIVDGQRFAIPLLREHGASFVHTFADDIVALFDKPLDAVRASVAIQEGNKTRRVEDEERAECCIGIGYGDVYAIGPNHAMGDEMNRASKLGEDTARGGEILVTEQVAGALEGKEKFELERQTSDDLLFPYFRVTCAS